MGVWEPKKFSVGETKTLVSDHDPSNFFKHTLQGLSALGTWCRASAAFTSLLTTASSPPARVIA
eukprot:COSAG02_NODE_52793_length_305_cov_2.252427_1_plen_63_part_01